MNSKSHFTVGSEAMPACPATITTTAVSAAPVVLRALSDLSVDDIIAMNSNLDRLRKDLIELATMAPDDAPHFVGYHIGGAGPRLITDVEVHELSSKVHQEACCLVFGYHPVDGKRAQQMFFGSSAASQAIRSTLIEFMALCLVCDRNGGFPTMDNSKQIWDASGILQRLMHKHPSF